MALKVYRMPIGFHDAYVAAPSQKAALAAWGSDANLFARGVAEVVTDPALTKEPLAHPGEVIKRLRGTAEEQIAAAPPVQKRAASDEKRETAPAKAKAVKPRPPRPDRADVDAAEAALSKAEARQHEAEQRLADEERALAERRRALRAQWIKERDELEAARDAAEEAYQAALKKWQVA